MKKIAFVVCATAVVIGVAGARETVKLPKTEFWVVNIRPAGPGGRPAFGYGGWENRRWIPTPPTWRKTVTQWVVYYFVAGNISSHHVTLLTRPGRLPKREEIMLAVRKDFALDGRKTPLPPADLRKLLGLYQPRRVRRSELKPEPEPTTKPTTQPTTTTQPTAAD